MLLNSVVALALLATSVSAQTNATYIDPNDQSVTPQLRASWCNGQSSNCNLLCDKDTKANTCQPDTLTYSCLCQSNGSAPDVAAYMDTLPYFICEKSYDLCIAAHPNDALGQSGCQTNIRSKCGTGNASEVAEAAAASSSSSSSAAPSSTSSASSTSSSTASATSSSATPSATKNAAAVLKIGKDYGTGIVAAGLVAAFGVLL